MKDKAPDVLDFLITIAIPERIKECESKIVASSAGNSVPFFL